MSASSTMVAVDGILNRIEDTWRAVPAATLDAPTLSWQAAPMTSMSLAAERKLREEVFAAVSQQYLETNRLTRQDLVDFTWHDERLPVIDYSKGIRNPAGLTATLSVVSAVDGPYADGMMDNGLFRYSYEGTSREGTNTKLREAMWRRLPILLFLRPRPNDYIPIFPVYVVGDDPANLEFHLDVSGAAAEDVLGDEGTFETVREYRDVIARRRVHQPLFRHNVLVAYDNQCTICQLKLPQLLDAAHIVPDSEAAGVAAVPNGLSLCKIHHASFDAQVLGISPDHEVRVNDELLTMVDGPMLLHGLQEMHGRHIVLPQRRADQPNRELLALQFERFLQAC